MNNKKQNLATITSTTSKDELVEAMRREIMRLNADLDAMRKIILDLQSR